MAEVKKSCCVAVDGPLRPPNKAQLDAARHFSFPPAGGVPGAAAVGPLLPDLRRLPAAGGERVAVVRPQVQPPGGADAGQPEQRLHPRLPAVPGLRPPGGAHGL